MPADETQHRDERRMTVDGAEDITPRELQLLQFAADGVSSDEIGERLQISRSTVDGHFTNVYRKFGVHTKSGAVAVALRRRHIS